MKRFDIIFYKYTLVLTLGIMLFFVPPFYLQTASADSQNIVNPANTHAGSDDFLLKVAPGDSLPISIKLSNFGGNGRIDVLVTYEIIDNQGMQIYATNETVAVETTANFVKNIQIPKKTSPGEYIAKASVTYQGQIAPATTQFPFMVENKMFGLFQSDFYFYAIATLIFGIVAGLVSRFFIKKRHLHRITSHEYPQIPAENRIFYEIVSDIIMDMRYRVGDQALDIAKNIEGLVIDPGNGRIVDIKTDPAKIVALLILQYEKLLGQKISFTLKKPDIQTKDRLVRVDKNLIFIKKYL